jgi:nitroreductase
MTETPPTNDPAEIAARLRMPMVDAMETQRAVRRLDTTRPVEHDLLLRLLELSLKAPTSSNTQDWT